MPTGIYKRTEEHRKKIGKAVKRHWQNPEYRTKGRERMLGNKNPAKRPEVREKLSEIKKKYYQHSETRVKSSEIMKKHYQCSEAREKAREITKKLWQDPEYRRKHIEAMYRPEVSMKRSGKNSFLWKGGKESYWRRLGKKVWEEYHDRKIPKGYVIHHKDGNYRNIDPKNLELIASRGKHVTWHYQLKKLKERSMRFLDKGN